MKRIWLLAAGFLIGTSMSSSADTVKGEVPPKVEESTPEAAKAAVHAASSEADQWAAKNAATATDAPKMAEEAAKESVQEPAKEQAKPAETPKPAAQPKVVRTGLNEMKGKYQSKSMDPRTLRVIVDGGFNVEFPYDSKTAIVNGGSPISIDDLEYNDEVIIRYSGKDLYALEIDRVRKAQRPQ